MNYFDLIEFQQRARQMTDPKKLFELLEDCYRRFERGEIGRYELDEMRSVIEPQLQTLAALKRNINGEEAPPTTDEQVADVTSIDLPGADESSCI